MDDGALLARIDRRLDLTEDHIRQGNEFLQGAREAIRDNARAIDDLRVALSQWNLRQEKMMRAVLAATQEMATATQEMATATREMVAGVREARNEGVAEARAQRAALFAILDELKGRGGPATA